MVKKIGSHNMTVYHYKLLKKNFIILKNKTKNTSYTA